MESLPLSGQHAARAFLPPAADMLVAAATIVCRFAAFPGGKAAIWAFPIGNISPAFEKAGQKGVGAPPLPVHAEHVQIRAVSQALFRLPP